MSKQDIAFTLLTARQFRPRVIVKDEIHYWDKSKNNKDKKIKISATVEEAPYHFLILDCPTFAYELVKEEYPAIDRRRVVLRGSGIAERKKLHDGITVTYDFGDSYLVFEGPQLFVEDYDLMAGDNLVNLLDWMSNGGRCPLVHPLAPPM